MKKGKSGLNLLLVNNMTNLEKLTLDEKENYFTIKGVSTALYANPDGVHGCFLVLGGNGIIPGDKIIGFYKTNNTLGIEYYRGEDPPFSVFKLDLGLIENDEITKDWIKRVNSIYERRRK